MSGAFKLTGLDGVLELLQSLPAEVVSKGGGPVRTSLRKGALVIKNEAAMNLARVTEGEDSTGLLLANLVVTRGRKLGATKGERYLIRVRRKSYNRQGVSVSTAQTGRFLEYGTEDQPAEPWLRPAFAAKADQAIRTTERELVIALDRVVKKLARSARR